MKIPGYLIKQQIGQGGMAMVYYAIQESLGRPVALKIMNPLLADRAEFSQRFLNEGRLLAALRHNHIITIYDIGVSEQYHYISMEYVDGGDLKQRLLRGLTPLMALDYMMTLGHCLKAAHDRHIVHRDIKPVNVLFRADDTLLLTDFGVAKNLATLKELTDLGSMVGSPYYLSPEQALGHTIDGRADLYSLGIVLYEMLLGERPFQGDSALEIAMQHIHQPLPLLPPSLSHFQPLLEKMTAKDPQHRFPHAASLLTAAQQLRARIMTAGAQTTGGPDPHRTAYSAPAERCAMTRPQEAPATAGAGLDETLILSNTETGGEESWGAPAVTRAMPPRFATLAKLGVLAGASSLMVLAVVLASGGLSRVKHPPAAVVLEPPQTLWNAPPTTAVSPAPSIVDTTMTMEHVPPLEESPQVRTDAEETTELLASTEVTLPAARPAAPAATPADDVAPAVLTHDRRNAASAQRYYELAQQAFHAKKMTRAKQHVRSGLRVQSDHPDLLALQEKLTQSTPRHGRPQPPAPPARLAPSRPKNTRSSRNGSEDAEKGFLPGVKKLFHTSPGASYTPDKSSVNE